MDVDRIRLAVASGVSAVCATCRRYWAGREQRLPEPRCTATNPCGSPFAGMTFPEYDGPMTDFARFCFVCGANATHGVKVREDPRVIGMCPRHLDMLGKVEPVGLKLNGTAAVDIIDRFRGRLTRERFQGPVKKTLGQVIADTEAEFAAEEQSRR